MSEYGSIARPRGLRVRAGACDGSRILVEALARGQEQPDTPASGRTDKLPVGQTDDQWNARTSGRMVCVPLCAGVYSNASGLLLQTHVTHAD